MSTDPATFKWQLRKQDVMRDWPSLDEEEAEEARAEQRQREAVDPLADLIDAMGNVRVRFWTCKVHRRGRVEWRGDVAHCLESGCDQTSAPAVR